MLISITLPCISTCILVDKEPFLTHRYDISIWHVGHYDTGIISIFQKKKKIKLLKFLENLWYISVGTLTVLVHLSLADEAKHNERDNKYSFLNSQVRLYL